MSFLHSKQIFGDDAEVFRPERWLEAEPEQLGRMNSVDDLIFHSEKYQCLGKSVALMEYNKIFVKLFKTFEYLWLMRRSLLILRMRSVLALLTLG